MFYEKLKELMAAKELTARQVHELLQQRGVEVSLWTFRKWMHGSRKPKPYVQEAILRLLTS